VFIPGDDIDLHHSSSGSECLRFLRLRQRGGERSEEQACE
jgi:hypothetical protein